MKKKLCDISLFIEHSLIKNIQETWMIVGSIVVETLH